MVQFWFHILHILNRPRTLVWRAAAMRPSQVLSSLKGRPSFPSTILSHINSYHPYPQHQSPGLDSPSTPPMNIPASEPSIVPSLRSVVSPISSISSSIISQASSSSHTIFRQASDLSSTGVFTWRSGSVSPTSSGAEKYQRPHCPHYPHQASTTSFCNTSNKP